METSLTISLNIDEEKIKKEAFAMASSVLNGALTSYFRKPYYTHAGSHDKGGAGYVLIKEQIEGILSSETFVAKIHQHIDEQFDQAMKSATDAAMGHAIRGKVFPRIADRLAKESENFQPPQPDKTAGVNSWCSKWISRFLGLG